MIQLPSPKAAVLPSESVETSRIRAESAGFLAKNGLHAPAALVEAASNALRMGWSLVPGLANTKRPCLGEWTTRPRLTPAELKGFVELPHLHCMCVRTGGNNPDASGVIVLDLDVKAIVRPTRAFFAALPATVTARTPSGGLHLYFAAPKEAIKNFAGKFEKGVDLRSDGGQVVMAGVAGREWLAGRAPWEVPFAAWEAETVHRALGWVWPPPADAPEKAPYVDSGLPPTAFQVAEARSGLSRACAAIREAPEGTGNETANRKAFTVGSFFVGNGVLPYDEAEAALCDAVETWASGAEETKGTVRRALRDGCAVPVERGPAEAGILEAGDAACKSFIDSLRPAGALMPGAAPADLDAPAHQLGCMRDMPTMITSANPPEFLAFAVLTAFAHEDGTPRLTFYKDQFYAYTRGKGSGYWKVLEKNEPEALCAAFLRVCQTKNAEGEIHPIMVTRERVNEVLFALRNLLIANHAPTEMPSWLGARAPAWGKGRDVRNLIVMRDCIFDPSNMAAGGDGEALDPSPALFSVGFSPLSGRGQFEEPTQFKTYLHSVFLKKIDETLFEGPEEAATARVEAERIAKRNTNIFLWWIGYNLIWSYDYHKAVFLVGPPASGKSTLLALMHNIIGEEMSSGASFGAMGQRFGTTHLLNKKTVTFGDVRFDGKDRNEVVQSILQISGGDKQFVDRKNIDGLTVVLPCRMTASTNYIPAMADKSAALTRRLVILETPNPVPVDLIDAQFLSKLKAQSSGIALAGLRAYMTEKNPNATIMTEEHHDEIRRGGNPVFDFIAEEFEKDAEAVLELPLLFPAWLRYCEANKVHQMSRHDFHQSVKQALSSKGSGVRKARRKVDGKARDVLIGLRLKHRLQQADIAALTK